MQWFIIILKFNILITSNLLDVRNISTLQKKYFHTLLIRLFYLLILKVSGWWQIYDLIYWKSLNQYLANNQFWLENTYSNAILNGQRKIFFSIFLVLVKHTQDVHYFCRVYTNYFFFFTNYSISTYFFRMFCFVIF